MFKTKAFLEGENAYKRGDYSEALDIWLEASEKEDAASQYQIALSFYDLIENETEENQELGFEYLLRAAKNGSPEAQHAIGIFYQGDDPSIIVPEPDRDLSRQWLFSAAENGSVQSMIEIGILGIEQADDNISLQDAEKFLEQAKSLGEPKATNALGIMYQRNDEYEKAAEYFELSRTEGYAIANVNLARLYLEGHGVEKNLRKAVDLAIECSNETADGEIRHSDAYYTAFALLEKLAAEPYEEPLALKALGERAIKSAKYSLLKTKTGAFAPPMEETNLWENIYPFEYLIQDIPNIDQWLAKSNQEDFNASVQEALTYFAKASDLGDNESCFNIGMMIQLGLVVEKSDRTAIAHFERAAANGHIEAKLQLAILEDKKNPNSNLAFEYFFACAQLDLPIAQYETGRRYDFGFGVNQNFEEAAYWYKRAIICSQSDDKANVLASFNIGLMYQEGRGVTCSLEEAYMRVTFAALMSKSCAELADEVTEHIESIAEEQKKFFNTEQIEKFENSKKNYRKFPE